MLPCRRCDMCEIGEYASCRDYDYFGSRRDGGFCEYVAVPKENLVPLPDSVGFCEAAMIEPAAVSLHGLMRCGVGIGDIVLIYGAGSIGLMTGMLARIWGAGRVILLDIDEQKLAFAREMGFADVLKSDGEAYLEQISRMTDGRGADIAVDAVGISPTLSGCIRAVKPMGDIVCVGNYPADITLGTQGIRSGAQKAAASARHVELRIRQPKERMADTGRADGEKKRCSWRG